jgi:hypothetical protein
MQVIDQVYASIKSQLPDKLRNIPDPPFLLSISKKKKGGWGDYIKNPIIFDLPLYIFNDYNDYELGKIKLFSKKFTLFREIHHIGGIYALISDKIADGQYSKYRKVLFQLKEAFFELWEFKLKSICVSFKVNIDSLLVDVQNAWQEGLELEKRCFEVGRMSLENYVLLNRLKLQMYSISTQCLLYCLDMKYKISAFCKCFELILIAWQCLDDSRDDEEDRGIHSISFPCVLGYNPGSLAQAGYLLTQKAIYISYENGFPKISSLLMENSRTILIPYKDEFDLISRLGGWIINLEIFRHIMKGTNIINIK